MSKMKSPAKSKKSPESRGILTIYVKSRCQKACHVWYSENKDRDKDKKVKHLQNKFSNLQRMSQMKKK